MNLHREKKFFRLFGRFLELWNELEKRSIEEISAVLPRGFRESTICLERGLDRSSARRYHLRPDDERRKEKKKEMVRTAKR
jgi:hypothetical protein